MKKLLLACVLMLGVIFVGTSKLGAAKMDNNITEVKAQHILVLSEAEAINLKKQIVASTIFILMTWLLSRIQNCLYHQCQNSLKLYLEKNSVASFLCFEHKL